MLEEYVDEEDGGLVETSVALYFIWYWKLKKKNSTHLSREAFQEGETSRHKK